MNADVRVTEGIIGGRFRSRARAFALGDRRETPPSAGGKSPPLDDASTHSTAAGSVKEGLDGCGKGGEWVSPEEPLNETATTRISRRRMLRRIGAGAVVAWTAPVLTSMRAPAFAQYGHCVNDTCGCDLGMPCNVAIPCGPGGTCNCWVQADGSACFCGVFDACSNHQACRSNVDCPSDQCCIENCCGRLCYTHCSGSGQRPVANPLSYGVRAF
jgi:hypothetical protein